MKCMFCDSQITLLNGYRVCRECETAYFDERENEEEIYRLVSEYLEKTEKMISDKQEKWDELEAKKAAGETISDDEQSALDAIAKFRRTRGVLNYHIRNKHNFHIRIIRGNLYDLIDISSVLDRIL